MENFDENNLNSAADFRFDQDSRVGEDCVFYMVHKVSAGSSAWLRHDIVLADNLDSIAEAIADIHDRVFKTSGGNANLVFLGSLLALNEALAHDSQQQEIAIEIHGLRASSSGEYAVFGIVGESQIILMSVRAKNALDASISAAERVHAKLGKSFSPLEVSLCDSTIDYLAIEANFRRVGQTFNITGNVPVH